MNEIRRREIVEMNLGEKYVSVIASGISRYQTECIDNRTLSEEDVITLANKAKIPYDLFENLFNGSTQTPIGTRRDLIKMYLNGEDILPHVSTFIK